MQGTCLKIKMVHAKLDFYVNIFHIWSGLCGMNFVWPKEHSMQSEFPWLQLTAAPMQRGVRAMCPGPGSSGPWEELESKVPPLGIHILPHLEKSKLNLNLVDDASPLDIIPWKLSVPIVRFDLTSFKKDTTNMEIYKQLYLQLIFEYPLSKKVFTDGSKTEEGVAAVAVSTKRMKKLLYVGFQTTVQYIQQSWGLLF